MAMQGGIDRETQKTRKPYAAPKLERYGDLRSLSKGQAAYDNEEGPYTEMTPPS